MKITRLRVYPIARVFALIYAVIGFFFWLVYCFGRAEYITLPFGFIAPFLNMNVNLNLHRFQNPGYNILLLFASVVAYALSGWVTSAVAILAFNVYARLRGGISADFLRIKEVHN